MVRIVWGVILILLGLFAIGQTFVALSFLQATSVMLGKGDSITPQMLSQVDFVSSFFFSLGLCLSGSLLIYFGSKTRKGQTRETIIERRIIPDDPGQHPDW